MRFCLVVVYFFVAVIFFFFFSVSSLADDVFLLFSIFPFPLYNTRLLCFVTPLPMRMPRVHHTVENMCVI